MATAIIRHVQLMRAVPDFSPIPKVHMAYHLVRRMLYLGSPRVYATWEDEATNKVLKASCGGASQLTFETTVLSRMGCVLNPQERAIR